MQKQPALPHLALSSAQTPGWLLTHPSLLKLSVFSAATAAWFRQRKGKRCWLKYAAPASTLAPEGQTRPIPEALCEPQVTVVMKFGGSSVANAQRMREVADIICSFPEHLPCIVLSAMGKVRISPRLDPLAVCAVLKNSAVHSTAHAGSWHHLQICKLCSPLHARSSLNTAGSKPSDYPITIELCCPR